MSEEVIMSEDPQTTADHREARKALVAKFPDLRGPALRDAILTSVAGPGATSLSATQVYQLMREMGYGLLDAANHAERLAEAYDANGNGSADAPEIDALLKDLGLWS
jgi:hypothetical protein